MDNDSTIITDRVRSTRGGNSFSLYVSPQGGRGVPIHAGIGTPLPPPQPRYHLPPHPSQGTPLPPHPAKVPPPPAGPGQVPPLPPTRPRYPPPHQHSVDWLCRGRYASCVLAQEDFLVFEGHLTCNFHI